MTNAQPTQMISGTINSCNFKKSGISAEGKNWTIYEVVIQGEKYSTFDSMFQNMIGQQGTWNYFIKQTQGKNGQVYNNKTLVPAEIRRDVQPQQTQQTQQLAGATTPIVKNYTDDKEETSKQIMRMNALTNSIKFLEGKPVDELVIMTTAEKFYQWITDTSTSKNEEEINIETALDEIPF